MGEGLEKKEIAMVMEQSIRGELTA
jgi:hypothetical protein